MAIVTVGTTPLEVLPRDPSRVACTIENLGTNSRTIYLMREGREGLKAGNAEYRLLVNVARDWIREQDGPDIGLSWWAVADGAGGQVIVADERGPVGG